MQIKTEQQFFVPGSEKWLDVGCGPAKIPGAVGIDRCQLPGVDTVHDLNKYPWPFAANTFDHVVCKHVLPHLDDFVRAVEEIHRVTKPGGIVEILAPHYASDNANTDPTFRVRLGLRSMHYFCEQFDFKYQYYSSARFQMVRRRVSFRENKTDFRKDTKANLARHLGLEWAVNTLPRVYERFFVYLLIPSEIYFKLKVLK